MSILAKARESDKLFWAVFVTLAVLFGIGLVYAGGVLRGQLTLNSTVPPGMQPSRRQLHVSAPMLTPTPIWAPAYDYTIPPIVNGMVPVLTHIPTKERVAFLTIDDGIVTNSTDAQLMMGSHTKATFFLVYRFINTDYPFFANLAFRTGSDIENHSYDHYMLTNLTYDQQKLDICKNADIFATWFGKRPVLFRPSGGAYNDLTLQASAACGMRALVTWDAAINNGAIKFQHGSAMQPGDIVLMHFRSTFAEDLDAFVKAAQESGLQPNLLVNWLSAEPRQT